MVGRVLQREERPHYVNALAWVDARFAHRVKSPRKANGGAVLQDVSQWGEEGGESHLELARNSRLGFLLSGSRGPEITVWRPAE